MTVKERVTKFLEAAEGPATAERILAGAAGLTVPDAARAEKVLSAILEGDPAYESRGGMWQLVSSPNPESAGRLAAAAVIHIEASQSDPALLAGAIVLPYGGGQLEFTTADLAGSAAARQLESLLDCVVAGWSQTEMRLWRRLLSYAGLSPQDDLWLSLRGLAARALERPRGEVTPGMLAGELRLPLPDPGWSQARARFLYDCLQSLLERVPPRCRTGLAELLAWIREPESVDFGRFAFGREFLSSTPAAPGVYIMRNRAADVIYVGKSRNVRRRLHSYFAGRALAHPKIARIHRHLHSIEVVACESEIEALLLETQLIRDLRPPVNLQAEIHEGPARYGAGKNLIVISPGHSGDKATLYYIRDGVFAGTEGAVLGHTPTKRAARRMKNVFYSGTRKRRTPWEPWELELVSRWLTRNRRNLNCVDVDLAGSFETALGQLTSYLRDPDRLRHKVLYR